jgi:hypothetical protein
MAPANFYFFDQRQVSTLWRWKVYILSESVLGARWPPTPVESLSRTNASTFVCRTSVRVVQYVRRKIFRCYHISFTGVPNWLQHAPTGERQVRISASNGG